jgi:hypothetical protein
MTLQLGALRDALIEAGASTETAGKAADELAGYENQLAKIESTLKVHTWMLSLILVVLVSPVLVRYIQRNYPPPFSARRSGRGS